MTKFHVVIPARQGSTRFPGKPLALLAGQPMISHVVARARASGASSVIVATDDEQIGSVVHSLGATVAMTNPAHVSGTDRVAEVARQQGWPAGDIVVNLQGDSPLMPPVNVAQAAALLQTHSQAAISTLCVPIESEADRQNPNVVKVVMDETGRALYFSRAPIPATAHGAMPGPAWRHLGLYAYRVGGLAAISAAPACALEQSEKLEQLRALWMGLEIRLAVAREIPGPDVDSPADVPEVERRLAQMGGNSAGSSAP